ncbi:defender against death DAD protein [Aureobasidium pullulans]|uniref:Dolichyl-diphosphooligosaccharide--protein glycosyltransferase subunit OST2 n=1 Tax=Aureobasidium pullulans TaxID=5580 RepID=A0A4T0CE08_AURPU|nr:defender against death DAD protein [Aureobasidium pullulans]
MTPDPVRQAPSGQSNFIQSTPDPNSAPRSTSMAPKKNAAAPAPSQIPPSTAKPSHGQTSASSQPTKPIAASAKATSTKSTVRNSTDAQEIALAVWDRYVQDTPQRVKLIDVFMTFLIFVGALQFLYCVIGGNYPFNAFLSGFSATVGQFVLTASLRIQSNPQNKADFVSISHERAFADYVFGSLILHFFCVNFIN